MGNQALNMASVIASDSFYIGGNWGFVLNTNEDYEKIITILKSDNEVKLIKVSNGFIVFCNSSYLKTIINQVEPITNEVINKQNTRLKTEILEFQKFLTGVLRGTSKYGVSNDNYIEYNIGLYSCNNLNKIRLNGIIYPAFSLTLEEALKEIIKLRSQRIIYICTSEGFIDIKEVVNFRNLEQLFLGLEISHTSTGVFLTIRVQSGC